MTANPPDRGDRSPGTRTAAGQREGEPVLRLRGVRKAFGADVALDGIDLEVAEGEVVVVVGPSGSGKSTLVRCIHQLEALDAGAVYLDGALLGFERHRGHLRPLTGTQVAAQRRRIGMVFQQFNLFPHFTVLRNLTEAPVRVHGRQRTEVEAAARALLDRVGLADKAAAYPRHLSGGQQQRVAIARALAARPRVLLFDEPTSALDPELVDEVLAVMRDLAREGMTMIVVTHELRFAREVADRCVFMESGRVVETGPPDRFFGSPETARLRTFLSRLSDELAEAAADEPREPATSTEEPAARTDEQTGAAQRPTARARETRS